MSTQTKPSRRNAADTSSPTVTALHATPAADRGDVAMTTTIASSDGMPTNSTALCSRCWWTITPYASVASATAAMHTTTATRAGIPAVAAVSSVGGAAAARSDSSPSIHATKYAG